jgi:hypothetical protein
LIESAPHRLPWIRIFAEAVVVVGSILLAFAIDAWWDYRGELRQEDEIVQALEAEFTLNREKLEQDIEGVREYTAAAQRLLRAARSNAVEAQGVDSLGTDLWQSLSWRTANLSTANLDVIVSTGRLDLIRDAQLRSALAGWKARLEDMAEEEEYEWREIVERYRPYMGRFVAIPSLEGDSAPPPPSGTALRRLLANEEFQSRLSMRVDVSLFSLRDKGSTLAELDRILGLLRGSAARATS